MSPVWETFFWRALVPSRPRIRGPGRPFSRVYGLNATRLYGKSAFNFCSQSTSRFAISVNGLLLLLLFMLTKVSRVFFMLQTPRPIAADLPPPLPSHCLFFVDHRLSLSCSCRGSCRGKG